jgi:hypothetical protein
MTLMTVLAMTRFHLEVLDTNSGYLVNNITEAVPNAVRTNARRMDVYLSRQASCSERNEPS